MDVDEDRTHGGAYPDVDRVDTVLKQMPILGFGTYYVEAVQAARDALLALGQAHSFTAAQHAEHLRRVAVAGTETTEPERG